MQAKLIARTTPSTALEMAGIGHNRPVIVQDNLIKHLRNKGRIDDGGVTAQDVICESFADEPATRRIDDGSVTAQDIGSLADLLSRPRAVIKGDELLRDGKKVQALAVLVDGRDPSGNPLLVALHPMNTGALRVTDVRSMFGKDNSMAYVLQSLQDGSMFWMPEKEIGRVKAFTGGLQLPATGASGMTAAATASQPQTDRSDPQPCHGRLVSRPITTMVVSDAAQGKFTSADKTGWQGLTADCPCPI